MKLVIWLQLVIFLFSLSILLAASLLTQALAYYSSSIVFRVASSQFMILNHQKFKTDFPQMKVMAKVSKPLVVLRTRNAWSQVYQLHQMSIDSFHQVQLYSEAC